MINYDMNNFEKIDYLIADCEKLNYKKSLNFSNMNNQKEIWDIFRKLQESNSDRVPGTATPKTC